MRIGFDMDGVVADLHTAFAGAAMRLFPDLDPAIVAQPELGASPPAAETADAGESEVPEAPPVEAAGLPLTRRQLDQVWDHIAEIEDFWETLPETEGGIVSRIAAIAEERRWEVIFLTSRPSTRGRTVQRQSQRWLDRLGFQMPSVFVVQGSRGRIADSLRLDVVIDDRPDNCLDVVLESKARAILIWRGAPGAIPGSAKRMGIAIDHTLGSCLDKLVEAEKAAETPADLMQRLRRLFGLGRPG
jgi:hypothetical protein